MAVVAAAAVGSETVAPAAVVGRSDNDKIPNIEGLYPLCASVMGFMHAMIRIRNASSDNYDY